MRKMINRKGSTLALTIIIFAVLMIFATFTLGFMVTENKQAMYHQNKTQAYYIARSGAVAVERAINQVFDHVEETDASDEIELLITSISTEATEINNISAPSELLSEGNADLRVEISKSPDEKAIYIDSYGSYNGIIELVSKVLPINININTTEVQITIKGDEPIIVMNIEGVFENLKDKDYKDMIKKVKKASDEDAIKYNSIIDNMISRMDALREYLVPTFIDTGPGTVYWGTYGESTDYYIDSELVLDATEIVLHGDVNLYIKDYLSFEYGSIVNDAGEYELNIYIYGDSLYMPLSLYSESGYSLFVGGYGETDFTPQDYYFNGNIYVRNGDIAYNVKKSEFVGNILTASENYIINATNASGSNSYNFDGVIMAPRAKVYMGRGKNDPQFSMVHLGYLIADSVYHAKDSVANNTEYGTSGGDGIGEIITDVETEKIFTNQAGYYR